MRTLLEGGTYFEGPRWRDGCWWVSDFYAQRVLAVTPEGAAETIVDVPHQPSGLGWMPDGSLLVVSMKDHRVLRRATDGRVTEHADLSAHCTGHANDMVVDRDGRAYVGEFGFDLMGGADPAPGTIVRIEPDGAVHPAAGGLRFPNGLAITPDGATLVFAETLGARLSACDIAADGSLGEPRPWAQVAEAPPFEHLQETIAQARFTPDGICLDAEGHAWVADALAGRVARVAEGGAVIDERRAPEGLLIFACMLGGEDGRTLLCCAAPTFGEADLAGKADAVLLTTEVDVPHAGRP